MRLVVQASFRAWERAQGTPGQSRGLKSKKTVPPFQGTADIK